MAQSNDRAERHGGSRRNAGLLGTKLVGLKVTAALESVNLFSKPILLSDKRSVREGRFKTYTFGVLFGVTAISLIAFYALRETVSQSTIYYPTLAQYQGLLAQGDSPTCTCQHSTYVGAGSSIFIPPAGDAGLNLCQSITALGTSVNTTSGFLFATDTSTLFAYSFLMPMVEVCAAYAQGLNAGLMSAFEQPLGPQLLTPDSFNETAYAAFLTGISRNFAALSTVFTPIAVGTYLPAMSLINHAFGASNHTPANCSCDPSYLAHLGPREAALRGCSFRISFDTRPLDLANSWWSCSANVNFMRFPVSLFLLPSFYEAIGAPASLVPQLTRFVGAENITMYTMFQDFITGSIELLYPTTPGGGLSVNQLQPGIYVPDYDRYYATCQPSECTTIFTSRPSAIAAVTTALGVISGAQTVLRVAVDYGLEVLFRWLEQRKAKKQGRTLSEGSDDDDSDSDAGGDGDGFDAKSVSGVSLPSMHVATASSPRRPPPSRPPPGHPDHGPPDAVQRRAPAVLVYNPLAP